MRGWVYVGYFLIGAGIGLVAAFALHWPVGRDTAAGLRSAGIIVGVSGVGLSCYAKACMKFDAVNRPADQAYEDGFESGFDKGYREGRSIESLQVVHLDERKRRAVD